MYHSRCQRPGCLPVPRRWGKVARAPATSVWIVKLNLGCGHVKFEGWINIDRDPAVRPDVVVDLGGALPFRDGVAECIHSEDFVDQLPLDMAYDFFRECHRILVPGGVMRVLTPDLARLVDFYCRGDRALVDLWRDRVALPLRVATLGEVLNRAMRLGGHTFLYDHETLTRVLAECGFRARRVDYNQSDHEMLRGLDVRRPAESVSMYYDCYRT